VSGLNDIKGLNLNRIQTSDPEIVLQRLVNVWFEFGFEIRGEQSGLLIAADGGRGRRGGGGGVGVSAGGGTVDGGGIGTGDGYVFNNNN